MLSRSGKCEGAVQWDGKSLGSWTAELEEADAVINLSGESAVLRWTPENKQKILNSRVDSTCAIGGAIMNSKRPPKVWINASAVGYYGDTGNRQVDESSQAGAGFLADVCKAWEAAQDEFTLAVTRKVKIRIGLPLSPDGGALEQLAKLAKGFLGGAAGSGRQFLPWIHIDDLTAMFLWATEDSKAPEVFNGVGPNPVSNRDFMASLRHALHRPWSPPAPAGAMKLFGSLVGMQVDPVLESSRVVPTAAVKAGFEFKHPQLNEALSDLFNPSAKDHR